MRRIRWIPGAVPLVVPPTPIPIPAYAPNIDLVIAAEITFLPGGMCNLVAHAPGAIIAAIDDHDGADVCDAVGEHAQATIVAALDDHAVHSHDFVSQGLAPGAPVQALGMPLTLDAIEDDGAVPPPLHTVPGAAATGVQNIAAPQGHAVGLNPVGHVGGVDLGHVATAAAVVHGAAANPIVAAVPTRVDNRNITLDVATLLGDLLTLTYFEVGERVLVS